MNDRDMNTEELIRELQAARQRIAELEAKETQLRETREELRASEMKFRSVAQSATDAIISIDVADKIVFWNRAAEKVFGYTEEEVLGRPVGIVIPESHRAAHRSGVERYLATGEPMLIGKTAELPGLRKGGVEFPIELSLSTWTTREGTFFTGFIRDISRRKAAQQALEASTKEARERTEELESLIQMVAHDLKSPVITIAGLVRVLKRTLSAGSVDEKIASILNQLGSSSETMEHFLKDLLDGLAVEGTGPELSRVLVNEEIQEVARVHETLVSKKGIALELDLQCRSPVLADRNRLRQIVDNLLINAVKHMGRDSNPIIRIKTREDDRFVTTVVSDNGQGIPSQYQARIFDRFFRVPKSRSEPGSGLGLAIVKRIVESFGGRIRVESEEGRGATFTFTFPKADNGAETDLVSKK
ncbi:MAG: PAS domain-containing sensor histidine kinase [Desulfomonile tiedjei]|nr:PAS domain-containing sensor histidine kinase [Desulfomonile tiedjei]